MGYEVAVEQVEPRTVAAVTTSATPETLADAIYRGLDRVWAALREQDASTGHNVVIYRDELRAIDVGVEVLGPFLPSEEVAAVTTPGGDAVTTVHWGDYSDIPQAYAALAHWISSNGRTRGVAAWEIYGDWNDEPAKRRTDIYVELGDC